MSDDQFTKLFKYMQQEFAAVRADIETTRTELKTDIDHVRNLVDHDAGHQITGTTEHAAMSHQLTRHQNWIKRLAKHVGLNLPA